MSERALSRDDYFRRWSELHGGYDPRSSRLTGGWLTGVHAIARPLVAMRIPPNALTMFGIVVAAAVVGLVSLGGHWVIVAAAVVVISGLSDNLDGAVAVMSGRTTRWGAVLDAAVDRICDGLYLVALWVVGAPAAACVIAGSLMLLQEYIRARAGAAGMSEVGVVTVWERPTRIIVTTMFLVGAGWHTSAANSWATWGAWAWLGLGIVGITQLVIVVRKGLSQD